jgi:hypothetical protein
MSDQRSTPEHVLLPDLLDFLQALNDAEVSYLVIGGHAVGLRGHSRATKDLAVWIGQDPRNRSAVIDALEAFGAPRHVVDMVRTAGASEFVFFGPQDLADVDRLERVREATRRPR